MDEELGALLWWAVEARLPLLVAAPSVAQTANPLLAALLDFLPPGVRVRRLAGGEESFAWLPEAADLGWRSPIAGGGSSAGGPGIGGEPVDAGDVVPPASPARDYLVGGEVGGPAPDGLRLSRARVFLRAPAVGYGIAATVAGSSLEAVLATIRSPLVGLSDEEIARLGIVVIAAPLGEAGQPRLTAVHYLRPRDDGRRGVSPAVLATWDPRTDRFDHFAWGIADQRAGRRGEHPRRWTANLDARREILASLAGAGAVEPALVRRILADGAARLAGRPAGGLNGGSGLGRGPV